MKKIKMLLMAVLVTGMAMTSCSKDDDNNSPTGGNIEGRWNKVKTVTTFAGESTTDTYTDNAPTCGRDYIEFLATGTYRDVQRYTVPSTGCQEDVLEQVVYAKSGTSLTIGEDTYEITRLTGSELRFKSSVATGGQTFVVEQFYTRAQN